MSVFPAVAVAREARTVIGWGAWEVKFRVKVYLGVLERDMVGGAEREIETAGAGGTALRVENVRVVLWGCGSQCKGGVEAGGRWWWVRK